MRHQLTEPETVAAHPISASASIGMHPRRVLAAEPLVGHLYPVSLGDQPSDRHAVLAANHSEPGTLGVGLGYQPLDKLDGWLAVLKRLAVAVPLGNRPEQLLLVVARRVGGLHPYAGDQTLLRTVRHHLDRRCLAEVPGGDP